ncbi:hypothetical protein PLICRDRAFT_37489 [Plicaturopsis crispa FD-325 SS-3]|nr:hypothetical protein PLICRDRAFT_37489 [Plicaturopsis crispa FD-325 SS-3]
MSHFKLDFLLLSACLSVPHPSTFFVAMSGAEAIGLAMGIIHATPEVVGFLSKHTAAGQHKRGERKLCSALALLETVREDMEHGDLDELLAEYEMRGDTLTRLGQEIRTRGPFRSLNPVLCYKAHALANDTAKFYKVTLTRSNAARARAMIKSKQAGLSSAAFVDSHVPIHIHFSLNLLAVNDTVTLEVNDEVLDDTVSPSSSGTAVSNHNGIGEASRVPFVAPVRGEDGSNRVMLSLGED